LETATVVMVTVLFRQMMIRTTTLPALPGGT